MTELERARHKAMLSRIELWIRFVGLGGSASATDFGDYLSGAIEPTRTEYNTAVQALNEHYLDLGADHPVPYLD